jgi:hypothetical protein
MDSLNEHNVYQIQLGHVLNEGDGEPCKDTITMGVQSLTAGTKNPLSKYNKAFFVYSNKEGKSSLSPPKHLVCPTMQLKQFKLKHK